MTNTKEDLREEFMEFISQECYDLAKYKAGKYDNKIWRWIVKALEEAREEGWQTGHKQTKEDYQAKEEEVRQKTLKEIYCMVIKNGSANRGWMLSKLTELYSKISGVNIPKTK